MKSYHNLCALHQSVVLLQKQITVQLAGKIILSFSIYHMTDGITEVEVMVDSQTVQHAVFDVRPETLAVEGIVRLVVVQRGNDAPVLQRRHNYERVFGKHAFQACAYSRIILKQRKEIVCKEISDILHLFLFDVKEKERELAGKVDHLDTFSSIKIEELHSPFQQCIAGFVGNDVFYDLFGRTRN